MASTYTITSSSTYEGRKMTLTLSQAMDIGKNQSVITWTLTTSGGSVNNYSTGPTKVIINGTTVYNQRRVDYDEYTFPAAKGSKTGTITVNHGSDGKLSIAVSLSTAIYYGSASVKTNTGTWTLDQIPRQANITAAPNFNDEQNPTISYSNPAGNAVTSLDACISFDGSADNIKYRAIDKTGSSYTFNLTDAERKVLRQGTSGSSRQVKFYVRTVIGGNTFYSSLTKTLSLANYTPTLNPSASIATDTTTYALTGSTTKFISGYTYVTVATGAAARKEATIKSQSISNSGQVISAASGTIKDVTDGKFTFSVTDSRGFTTTQTLTREIVPYVKLTCNLKPRISVSGEATINVGGNVFNGSFGAVQNTLALQYRYKAEGGSYSSWIGINGTKYGNTYDGSATLTGLDYQTKYTFQARATDKIGTVTTDEITIIALPVFDWGENDFRFNVPVTFAAGYSQAASLVDDAEPVADFVVEQGTSGIWSYRKWNSGMAECWGRKTVNVAVNTAWGSLYVSGYLYDSMVDLPFTFKEVPMINANLSANGAGGFLIASGSVPATTTSTGGYEIARGTSGAANNYVINYDVKGRWK